MKTIEFIVDYLRTEATTEELNQVEALFVKKQHPPINPEEVLNLLFTNCKRIYDETNSLPTVKFIKETTGWGLKDCKDYFDSNIR